MVFNSEQGMGFGAIKNPNSDTKEKKQQNDKNNEASQQEAFVFDLEERVAYIKENGLIGENLRNKATEGSLTLDDVSKDLGIFKENSSLESKTKCMLNEVFRISESLRGSKNNMHEALRDEQRDPQDLINLIFSEDCLLDQDQRFVTIESYLKGYYKDLKDTYGFDLNIGWGEFGEEENKKRFPEIVFSVSGEKIKSIPIVYGGKEQDETSIAGVYLSTPNSDGYPTKDRIKLKKPNAEDACFVEFMSTLFHEIDHSVFRNLHSDELHRVSKEINQLGIEANNADAEEQIAIAELKRERAQKQYRVLRNGYYGTLKSISEGLARKAERQLLGSQARGLAIKSGVNPELSMNLATLCVSADRLRDQANVEIFLYTLGDVIVNSLGNDFNMKDVYVNNTMEEVFLKHPEIVFTFFSEMVAGIKSNSDCLLGLKSDYPGGIDIEKIDNGLVLTYILDKSFMESQFSTTSLFFGRELARIKDNNSFITENISEEYAQKRINDILSTNPNLTRLVFLKSEDMSSQEKYKRLLWTICYNNYSRDLEAFMGGVYKAGEVTQEQKNTGQKLLNKRLKELDVPNFDAETGRLLSGEEKVMEVAKVNQVDVVDSDPVSGKKLSSDQKLAYMMDAFQNQF